VGIIVSMKRALSNKQLPESAIKYVLEGLVPYTDANLKLAFKTTVFMDDLEKIIRNKKTVSKKSLQNAYYRAIKRGWVAIDDNGMPKLTALGRSQIEPYDPSLLDKNTVLMVIFDIPEAQRPKRDRLRLVLKDLGFEQVQKSTWTSRLDYREHLKDEIKYSGLEEYVRVYEAKKV